MMTPPEPFSVVIAAHVPQPTTTPIEIVFCGHNSSSTEAISVTAGDSLYLSTSANPTSRPEAPAGLLSMHDLAGGLPATTSLCGRAREHAGNCKTGAVLSNQYYGTYKVISSDVNNKVSSSYVSCWTPQQHRPACRPIGQCCTWRR